jgi:hypothetical protein
MKTTRSCEKSSQPWIEGFVPFTQIWINLSIHMVIETSIDFFLPDEEGHPEMLKAASTRW